MIDRMLTWRSLAKDWDELNMVKAPIGEVVEETAKRFQKMIAADVDFSYTIDSRLPVYHSRLGVGSIVINLLTNASKYTGENKQIALAVADEEDAVILRVEDNGIGIPEKELERIFDPFYRVDSSLGGKAAGAGLGLAIVNHLVQSHRGSISIDTVEGQGSVFLVSLPRVAAEGAAT